MFAAGAGVVVEGGSEAAAAEVDTSGTAVALLGGGSPVDVTLSEALGVVVEAGSLPVELVNVVLLETSPGVTLVGVDTLVGVTLAAMTAAGVDSTRTLSLGVAEVDAVPLDGSPLGMVVPDEPPSTTPCGGATSP